MDVWFPASGEFRETLSGIRTLYCSSHNSQKRSSDTAVRRGDGNKVQYFIVCLLKKGSRLYVEYTKLIIDSKTTLTAFRLNKLMPAVTELHVPSYKQQQPLFSSTTMLCRLYLLL